MEARERRKAGRTYAAWGSGLLLTTVISKCSMVQSQSRIDTSGGLLVLLALPEICEIHTCLSGEEALLLCQTYKPQIVFTDIKMEGMDGIF